MIFTDDKKYYDILQSQREFGRLPLDIVAKERFTYKDSVMKGYDARYIFSRIGYNLRMTDIMASLGIEQIKKLDKLNAIRVKNVNAYNKALAPYENYLELPKVAKGNFHSYYGYPFVVKKNALFSRMDLIQHLEKNGIETRPFFGGCLPDQPAFRDEVKRIIGKLPEARALRDRSVFIGCHPALTTAHVNHVAKTFKTFFAQFA
jgi:CDP-6-deoxy-D-xylo-4-hexulose-3-dehydrase